jgi:hypothetical protein
MFAIPQLITADRQITSIATASAFTTILDVSADPLHETLSGGQSWGLWLDTPLSPYRTSGGTSVFLAGAHSTYRYQVTSNNWTSANISLSPAGAVRNSQNTGVEQDYDHRIWIFGVYADGANVYGIGHHEWYYDRVTVDGHPGFNNQMNHKWVTSPIWIKSTNNGAALSWATKTYTSYTTTGTPNPARLYMTPEGYGVQSYDTLYGWQHPSNIVKEGSYYYSFVDANNLVGAADALLDVGFSLIRWDDLDDPTSVEYWNGSGWTARNIASYQGNNAAQQPYLFFEVNDFDPYTEFGRTDRMAQSLRWHWPTQQWLLFGYDGRVNPSFVFTRSKTLANPQFEANGRTQIAYTGGGVNGDYTGNAYITVFDPAATDQNFTEIGNSPICVVSDSYLTYKSQTLAINVV